MEPLLQSRSEAAGIPERNQRRRVLVLGTGSFAEDVADWSVSVPGVTVEGFVANLEVPPPGTCLHGLPVMHISSLPAPIHEYCGVCAISTNRRQRMIDDAAQHGLAFTTLIHPLTFLPPSCGVATGVIVGPGVIVGGHVHVGAHTIIGRGSLVGHHSRIGRLVTIGPGANIAGKCCVGDGVYIAMGAVIRDGVHIGAGSVVGAGAVVVSDVPENVQVAGIPARVQKTGVSGL